MKKIILVIYMLLFAVNLFFGVFDRDDLLLPEYVKVLQTGGFTGTTHIEFSVYRKGFGYYLDVFDEHYELSRTEYKACVGTSADYEKPVNDRIECDGFDYSYRVKFPLREEKEYRFCSYGESLSQRVKMMVYLKRGDWYPEGADHLAGAMFDIFDEYNVNGALIRYVEDKDILSFMYGRIQSSTLNGDERYAKINSDVIAEIANAYAYGKGMSDLPYLGYNKTLMAKYVEAKSGKRLTILLPTERGFIYPESPNPYNFFNTTYFIRQQKDQYMPLKGAKFYRLRYFEHVPTGRETAYFKTMSSDDTVYFLYALSETKEDGFILIETRDHLTRPLLMLNLKLAFLTHGKIPVFHGAYMFIHATFIALVQNAILAVVLILRARPKR